MAEVAALRARADTLFSRGLHPPSNVIAKWPLPNYVDPETRGWEGPVILIVILVITIMVYAARMWARLVVAKNAGMDDLLMSFAMLPLIGLSIASILAIRIYGFQWHTWDQTAKTFVTSREITMAIELNYLVSTTLIKISILCFYRRITGSLTNGFVRWVWASIIFCALYGIIFCLLIIFTCTPQIGFFRLFDLKWRLKNEVKCHDEGAIIVACAIISTIQDLVICLLPIFLVWNLKMPKRQKAALCGIFGMGLVTCVCGILRTYYATYVYYYTYDITWYAYYGWIWTAIEADLGVICASAPALKVFFRRYFSLSTRNGYGSYGVSGNNKSPYQSSRLNDKAAPFRAAHSAGASRVEPEHGQEYGTPLKGITVSQGLDIRVEERDDISQKSFASTANLMAIPPVRANGWKTPTEWKENVRTALASNSRSESRSHLPERDVDRIV